VLSATCDGALIFYRSHLIRIGEVSDDYTAEEQMMNKLAELDTRIA
jgi:hypothetical protein